MQANAPQGSGALGRTFERVAVVRTLANRKVPSAIVHAFAPTGAEIAVVERHGLVEGLTPADLDAIESAARMTMTLRHPNVATVRDVWREISPIPAEAGTPEVCIASEFVEGETLEELRRLGTGGKELTIEVGVRVVVDVLAALSALHTLGAGSLAHGEITANTVIVGFDGLTRVVRPYRGAIAGKLAEPDWFSYAAPEVIRGGGASVHSDLYAVGVILWETLSRRKLFPKATREGRSARTLPVGKPAPPADATWAAPLSAVAERALANDPAARYTSAAEMAAAVRLAVRSKLAMPPRVAAAVDKLAGDRIVVRRNTNALPESLTPLSVRSGRPSRPSVPPEAFRALETIRASSRPPPPVAAKTPSIAVPKAPPVPSVAISSTAPPKPRPPVPPIKIAPPTPKPPPIEDLAPISIEASLVESAPMIAPAMITPPPPPMHPEPFIARPMTPAPVVFQDAAPVLATPPSSRRVPMIIGAVVLLLILLMVVVRATIGGSTNATTSPSTKPSGTGTREAAIPTTTIAQTATATSTSAPTTTTPIATTSESPENSATPETSATVAPDTSHRPHIRPRPTYDPMGI